MKQISHRSEILAASFAALFMLVMSIFVGAVGANAQTVAGTTGGADVVVSPPACITLTHGLSIGSRGHDVSILQAYLAGKSDIYPEGRITGYYGSLTARAVERFQVAHNIVSSGTAATTGYGAVGPRTRAVMTMCGIVPVPPVTTGSSTMITNADNNSTVVFQKGQRFGVMLGDTQNWSLNFDPTDIVTRVTNISTIRGEQGVYTATNVGTTTLHATGTAICDVGQACPMYAVLFQTTIVVK